jgi:folate-dependent phosphoribosylglycinamide formyltransferase PurN
MRVALLTNRTAQASLPILHRLATSEQVELQHVFFFNTLAAGQNSPLQTLRQFGWKKVLYKVCELISGKARHKLARWLGPTYVPPRSAYEFAQLHKLSYSLTEDMNSANSQTQLQSLKVDVLVVCVCKNILRAPLLATPDMHFINIHPSLLPDYRGPTPTFWMRYHGAYQTGFTIHHMTTNIDQGVVLAQKAMGLDCERSEAQTELQVFTLAAESLVPTLLSLQHAGTTRTNRDAESSTGSYHSYPSAADRRELQRRLRQRRGSTSD